MSRNDKGYIIPDPVDPGALRCFQIYVPDHTLYIAAFWSAYEFFTKWLCWERDSEHRGAEAAAVWRIAYDLAREKFENGEECDMAKIRYRPKPTAPWITQFKYDDELEWSDMQIQPHWDISALSAPPAANNEQAAILANGIIKGVHQNIAKSIIEDIADGVPADETKQRIVAELKAAGASGTVSTFVDAAYDELAAMTEEQREAYLEDCPYVPSREYIRPTIQFNPYWLNLLPNLFLEGVSVGSDAVLQALDGLASAMGSSALWTFSGGATGANADSSFGEDCDIPIGTSTVRLVGPIQLIVNKDDDPHFLGIVPFELSALERYIGAYAYWTFAPNADNMALDWDETGGLIPPGYSYFNFGIGNLHTGGGGQAFEARTQTIDGTPEAIDFWSALGLPVDNVIAQQSYPGISGTLGPAQLCGVANIDDSTASNTGILAKVTVYVAIQTS